MSHQCASNLTCELLIAVHQIYAHARNQCDESVNNVFGRTLNPWNTDLTAGGSSGGEAALLAMKGSIIGVGTDLGGPLTVWRWVETNELISPRHQVDLLESPLGSAVSTPSVRLPAAFHTPALRISLEVRKPWSPSAAPWHARDAASRRSCARSSERDRGKPTRGWLRDRGMNPQYVRRTGALESCGGMDS